MKLKPDSNGLLTMVFLVVKSGGDHLLVRRGDYLGLPGAEVKTEEDMMRFARRILFKYIAFQPRDFYLESPPFELISEFFEPWGPHRMMARCTIYEFPVDLHNHFENGLSVFSNIVSIPDEVRDITVKRCLEPVVCAA